MIKKTLLILIFFSLLLGCSAKDDGTTEKKVYEPNIDKRARAAADKIIDKEGGIFGKKGSTTYEFATSNVLWRATLKTLDFMPMANASYSGGVIITDWYSSENSNESMKIYVQFTSNELATSSLNIKSYIKKCDTSLKCSIKNGSDKVNNEILNKIVSEARTLSLQESSKKK